MRGANSRSLGLILIACLVGCGNLKYEMLRGTSVPNPPTAPVALYLKEFPVASKASVIERRVMVSEEGGGGGSSISALAEESSGITEISRPSRIEDLVGALLREMRRDTVRVFTDLNQIADLEMVRRLQNPFKIVSSEKEAQLILSGRALIRSQRISKTFSQNTTGVELELSITDVASGKTMKREKLRAGIQMTFNSRELEEAMAIAVVTYLTQKTFF